MRVVGTPVPTDNSVHVKVNYPGDLSDITHLAVKVYDILTQTNITQNQKVKPDGNGDFEFDGRKWPSDINFTKIK